MFHVFEAIVSAPFFGTVPAGGDQDDEEEVPQLERGDGPQGGEVPQEAQPPKRRQAQGGHQVGGLLHRLSKMSGPV